MKQILKKWIYVVCSFLFCTSLYAQNGIQFEEIGLEEALAKAQQLNKMVFVDCYTSWCGPCKKMSETVFTRTDVGDYFNSSFVNLKIDMEKGKGPELAKRFSVKAYPTFLIFDATGKEILRILGGQDAPEFISMIKNGIQNPIHLMNEKYDKGEKSKEFLASYVTALSVAFEIKKKNEVLDQLFKLYGDNFERDEWMILDKYLTDYHSYTFNYLLDHKDQMGAKFGKENVERKITNTLSPNVFNLLNNVLSGDSKYDEEKYDTFKKMVSQSGSSKQNYLEYNLEFLDLFVREEVGKCVKLYKNYYSNFTDDERFSAMLHTNMAVIKRGTKSDCKAFLKLINDERKRFNIPNDNELFNAIVNGLEKKIGVVSR